MSVSENWMPAEFAKFEQNPQIQKTGMLKLVLHKDEEKKKTIVLHQYSKAPLLTQKALYYDSDNPSMAYLFLMSSSGGVLQGDRYEIKISLGQNAIANITTQGATRIYKMESDYASQNIELEIGDDAYLEMLPDQIIPYANSRYFQHVNLSVGKNSTVVYSEIISPGRAARGELFDYEMCYLRFVAKNSVGMKFTDISRLEPGADKFANTAILGGNSVLGTMYVITEKKNHTISEQIRSILENSEPLCGFSFLPGDSGIVIRILGTSPEQIKAIFVQIIKIIRNQILGSTLGELRKT
ncbi:MAG: urease accessory protein UreD [Thaumarchaeota archaeon]|nr:urease accessory protein UreD [Nitrososphaerota archaeon]